MARALHKTPFVTSRGTRGFTLIEMMIVVAIVGILAVLAVVGYRKLVQSSHVSEATGMVQSIRIAQENYHSETQQYANISNDLQSYYPLAAPVYGQYTAWGGACTDCTALTWANLPVHVDGPVTFGYATVAGAAGAAIPPTVVPNVFPPNVTTDWYAIAADGDLDGNATEPNNTHVFGASWTNQITVDHEGF
jgi:type IV pilus assembly protein PilA